jgi:hypothetical protein
MAGQMQLGPGSQPKMPSVMQIQNQTNIILPGSLLITEPQRIMKSGFGRQIFFILCLKFTYLQTRLFTNLFLSVKNYQSRPLNQRRRKFLDSGGKIE